RPLRYRGRRTRRREGADARAVSREPAPARRAPRGLISRQRTRGHAVPSNGRLPRRRHGHEEPRPGRRGGPGGPQRLSGVALRGGDELADGPELRGGEPRARRHRAGPGGAAGGEPASRGGGDDPSRRPPDQERRRTRRRRARGGLARRAAARLRAAALRRRTLDDVSRDAGAAGPAGSAGQPAADVARLRVGARQFRGRPAGAAGGLARWRRCARQRRCPAARAGAARTVPSRRRIRSVTERPHGRRTIMKLEVQEFSKLWARETDGTLDLLRTLPVEHYDFRPDSGGRSLGELAWHLAEVDAYVSLGIERGEFSFASKPPHLDRPRRVEDLAPAYRIVHDDAVARVVELDDTDLY